MSKNIIVTPEIEQYRQTLGSVSPNAVAEMVGAELHDVQKEIASYFVAPKVHTWDTLVFLASRRLGKSFSLQKIAETLLLTPQSQIFLIAHSTSLSDTYFKYMLADLQKIKALEGKINWSKKEGMIEIPELNTMFITASYLNYDSRGIGKAFTHLIKEEHALVPPSVQDEINELISPTQANYGSKDGINYGKEIIVTTPRGSATGSYTGRTYLKGLEEGNSVVSKKWTIYDSPFLSEEEIQSIKDNTNQDVFAQEYMCEWSRTAKTVFRHYNPDKHLSELPVDDLKSMSDKCDVIVAMDIGFAAGSGMNILLYNNRTDTYYVIDEHYAKDEIVKDFMTVVIDKVKYWASVLDFKIDDVIFTYDPSAREAFLVAQKEFDISMIKAKNDRDNGINYVNRLFQGEGKDKPPRLFIRKGCKYTAQMIEWAEYKVVSGVISNQYAKDPSELDSHFELCDTVRYAVYTHFKHSHSQVIVA